MHVHRDGSWVEGNHLSLGKVWVWKLFEILKSTSKNPEHVSAFFCCKCLAMPYLVFNIFHIYDNDTHSMWVFMWKIGFIQCVQW